MVEPSISRTRTARPSRTLAKTQAAAEDPPKARAQGDRLLLGKRRTPAKTRPTSIAPEGNLVYYQKRHLDFQARHPDLTPPSYYLGYGDVYVRRFTEVLSPELSKEGQEWLVRARKNLQVAIEDELVRNPHLELDDQAFTAFAYDTHGPAYLNAGLTELPIDDLIRLAVTPNLSDTLNQKGLKVVAETAERVARDKLAAALDSPGETAQEVLNALKTSPDLLRDVAKLLNTAENGQSLREGLLKLKSWPGEVAEKLMDSLWEVTTRKLKGAFEALRKFQFRDLASA